MKHGDSLSAVWGSWAKELYKGAVPRFARFAEKVWGIFESDEEKAALLGHQAGILGNSIAEMKAL